VSVTARQVSRLKFVFEQEIRRADGALMLEAQITATSLKDGKRPYLPDELQALLD
jgi:acyl-CoA thioesterase FadM